MSLRTTTLTLVGISLSPMGLAAAPVPAAASSSSAVVGLLQTSLSLVFVLAVILGLAWLAKRMRLTPNRRLAALSVLAEVPVGPKERVVLLKVGDGQALVGVGADGIRSLSLLPTPVALPAVPVETSEPTFATRLADALRKGTNP